MSKRAFLFATFILALLAFAIPFEHQYDKLFRFFSLKLIPEGLIISPLYNKKIFFHLSDLVGLLFLSWGLIKIPWIRFFHSPLWVVFVCALCSIWVSPFWNYPVAYSRLLHLLTPIALFSFISNVFNEEEKRKITQVILFSWMVAGILQSGIAITQYFHQSTLGLRLFGEPSTLTHFKVNILGGSRWIFDSPREGVWLVYRACGTLPHPNILGGMLLVSLFATQALAMRNKIWALTIPFQFFAMALSYSRAALFGWILGNLVWFVAARIKKIENWKWMAAICSLSFLVSFILLHNQFQARGGIVNYNQKVQESDGIRILHQNTAFKIIRDKPWLGVGFSQFSERSQKYFTSKNSRHETETAPHNIFLFLACETGLISLGAFLLFIALVLYRGLFVDQIETITLLSLFISFLFIGCCDFYPILFQQGKMLFFLISGLLWHNPQKRPIWIQR